MINDNAAGAVLINVDAGCTGAIYTNVGATQSVGEPTGSCFQHYRLCDGMV
ncbi:MAG: hypothetical protein WDO71_12600 [Bacteroidota bacterium]